MFESLPISEPLRQALTTLGYTQLTPIQEKTLPILLAGGDIIGQSRTGSGKTTAFGVPLLEKISTETRDLQALVLCPTRELCTQVAKELRKLARYKKDAQVLTLSGGVPVYLDLKSLEHGAQVIVATPGRFLDHMKRGTVKLGGVKFVVLDEADRMLDMGFRPQIEEVLDATPRDRQTVLFSATFPDTIEALTKRYLKKPERVTIEMEKPDIDTHFYFVTPEQKVEALLTFLRTRLFDSVLVFCNQKFRVDELVEALRKAGHFADKLHGDLEQSDRDKCMAKFRNGSTRVLVATDVAARGIDVAGLDAVVNFDLTGDLAHFTHRIGRTGRAGQKGLAVSFLAEKETFKLQLVGAAGKAEPWQTLKPTAKIAPHPPRMNTILIAGGRKEKLRPGDILGALCGEMGLKSDEVGKIEIGDHVSYVGVARDQSRRTAERLKAGAIKGRKFAVHWIG